LSLGELPLSEKVAVFLVDGRIIGGIVSERTKEWVRLTDAFDIHEYCADGRSAIYEKGFSKGTVEIPFTGVTHWVKLHSLFGSGEPPESVKYQLYQYTLWKFKEVTFVPIESEWSVRLLHPIRPIRKCRILYDGEPLPWWDSKEPFYEAVIVISGGGNVRIPKGKERQDAKVVVMDGKEILETTTFGELPLAR
jgi:hypothetical protein